jgi:hypothetical protein
MSSSPFDARSHLESLRGRPFRAFNGLTMTVLEVKENVAVVRATAVGERGPRPKDEVILLAWVQWAMDRLLWAGEAPVRPGAFGPSTEIVVMLLLTLPGVRGTEDPLTVVLHDPRAWNLRPGNVVDRVALHERFGGNKRTRIAPSALTPNVFVFVDPEREETGRWKDGVVHVPGERARGTVQSSASRAVLRHREAGRTIRVFWRSGDELVYAGAFQADPREPFYLTEARGRGGVTEQRIVFRLVPAGEVVEQVETPRLPEPPRASAPAAPARPQHPRRPRFAPGGSVAAGLHQLGVRGPWPAIVLASCAAIAVTTWAWTSAPVRPAVTTWFLLLCPGMALVRLLPDRGLLLRLVLAVAASLTLETFVATFMLEAKLWAPGATLGILLLITVAATALDLRERPLPRWGRA